MVSQATMNVSLCPTIVDNLHIVILMSHIALHEVNKSF